jgi:predicted nuclease of predicted toxin-antitoxin system
VSLRFFADYCVPESVVQALIKIGYEVHRLKEYLPIDASDTAVITKAQELEAILISLNGDFADIVNYPPLDYKGIISLQIENHPEILPGLLVTLNAYLTNHDDMKHYAGKLLIAEVHRIRRR